MNLILDLREDKFSGHTYFVEYEDFQAKEGSIILPESHREGTRVATIVDASPGSESYKIGDKVLLGWFSGKRIHLPGRTLYGRKVDEERHRIVYENEIYAKVKKEE